MYDIISKNKTEVKTEECKFKTKVKTENIEQNEPKIETTSKSSKIELAKISKYNYKCDFGNPVQSKQFDLELLKNINLNEQSSIWLINYSITSDNYFR